MEGLRHRDANLSGPQLRHDGNDHAVASRLGVDPGELSARRAVNLYLFAVREWADEERLDMIEAAIEPPNQWDSLRRTPVWWKDDEDAWSAFATATRV